jgi:PKD domain
MSFSQTIKRTAAGAIALTMLLVAGLTAAPNTVSAIPYGENGTSTTKTPAFNVFTGVPNGTGNEADFLRIKPQASGNDAYVNSLNSACDTGSAYTVRTYVHNGADPSYNTKENGIAIARNTVVKMTAPLNTPKSSFEFKSTISASNAASVSDNAFLNCNGKTVKLALVPSSVKAYSTPLGFTGAPDSAVNGSLKIGSRVAGSGDVLGCWEDRVWVSYEVKVEEVPDKPKPSLGECKLLDVKTVGGRKITYDISGTTDNAQIVGYRVNFGDGNSSTEKSGEHEYAQDGTYTITAEVRVKYADGKEEWKSADNCMKQVTFEGDKPPKVVPPTPSGGPTVLPETGPAGVAAVVTAVTGMSTAAYYWVVRRRGEV